MPPNEATVLADFLIAPASLREVLTLKQFSEIFPKNHRINPAIKELYQELNRLRQEDINAVRQNIADEVKASKKLKRQCIRERQQHDRTAVAGLDPIALEMEEELSGHSESKQPHTLQSIHPSMEEACEAIESQIAEMEDDMQRALSEVQEAVGELSDLRYGRLSQTASGENIGEEVIATLKRLEAVCADPTG